MTSWDDELPPGPGAKPLGRHTAALRRRRVTLGDVLYWAGFTFLGVSVAADVAVFFTGDRTALMTLVGLLGAALGCFLLTGFAAMLRHWTLRRRRIATLRRLRATRVTGLTPPPPTRYSLSADRHGEEVGR